MDLISTGGGFAAPSMQKLDNMRKIPVPEVVMARIYHVCIFVKSNR